jgi:adenylate kinase family enzyme
MRDTFTNIPKFENSKLSSGWEGGKGRFLIDGFPRQMDQALKFDESVSYSSDPHLSTVLPPSPPDSFSAS